MNEDDVAAESPHVDDEVKLMKCELRFKWVETIETVVTMNLYWYCENDGSRNYFIQEISVSLANIKA